MLSGTYVVNPDCVSVTVIDASGLAGQRGFATFNVTSGNVAVLGLRFNGSAFSSIPANAN